MRPFYTENIHKSIIKKNERFSFEIRSALIKFHLSLINYLETRSIERRNANLVRKMLTNLNQFSIFFSIQRLTPYPLNLAVFFLNIYIYI